VPASACANQLARVHATLTCPALGLLVQVLEVCDDSQREQLLARVRAQLCTLKKYTYGKHIVARMEKLLSAGAKIQASSEHSEHPRRRLATNSASFVREAGCAPASLVHG